LNKIGTVYGDWYTCDCTKDRQILLPNKSHKDLAGPISSASAAAATNEQIIV
jgi:hypothetical protein